MHVLIIEPVLARYRSCALVTIPVDCLLCNDSQTLFRGLFVRSDPWSNGTRCTGIADRVDMGENQFVLSLQERTRLLVLRGWQGRRGCMLRGMMPAFR
jgi:hypothetical protein